MITWGNTWWPVFLSVSGLWVLLGFGIPEGIALATHPSKHIDNTLSAFARTQLHLSVATFGSAHTLAWWLSFLAWMMFVVFITGHIWFLSFG